MGNWGVAEHGNPDKHRCGCRRREFLLSPVLVPASRVLVSRLGYTHGRIRICIIESPHRAACSLAQPLYTRWGHTYMEDTRYFSRSWALLTRQKGWIKPVLVLAIALLVPVAGPLAVLGYGLEWARLSAWGADASPKQRGVRVGECIASGWRAFVVELVWGLAFMLVSCILIGVLSVLFGGWGASLAHLIVTVCGFFFSLVVLVAQLRAVIYTKIRAGLNPRRVFEMIGRDTGGLLKLIAIPLVTGLIVGAVMLVGYVVIFVAIMGDIINYAPYLSDEASYGLAFQMLGEVLGKTLPTLVILWYVGAVITTAAGLLEENSVGLWMRQFDVPAWGGSSDPLPAPKAGLPAGGSPVPPAASTAAAAEHAPAEDAPVSAPSPDEEDVAVSEPAPVPAEPAAPETVAENTEPPAPETEEPIQAEPASAPEVSDQAQDELVSAPVTSEPPALESAEPPAVSAATESAADAAEPANPSPSDDEKTE